MLTDIIYQVNVFHQNELIIPMKWQASLFCLVARNMGKERRIFHSSSLDISYWILGHTSIYDSQDSISEILEVKWYTGAECAVVCLSWFASV